MSDRFIAKYRVMLINNSDPEDYILYQTLGGFAFRRPGDSLPEPYDMSRHDSGGWNESATAILKDVVAGKIKPFWGLTPFDDDSNTDNAGKCTCPDENFRFNGIGCKCNGK